jgi:hypothetical protein
MKAADAPEDTRPVNAVLPGSRYAAFLEQGFSEGNDAR